MYDIKIKLNHNPEFNQKVKHTTTPQSYSTIKTTNIIGFFQHTFK